MAHNLHAISKVGWLAQGSLLKTLAHKHKMSVAKTATKYRAIATIDGKEYKVFEARVRREGKKDLVAMYGGVSLARNPRPANINDRKPTSYAFSRSEVIKRLESNECDMCGKKSKVGNAPHKEASRHQSRKTTMAEEDDCHEQETTRLLQRMSQSNPQW